MLNALSGKKTYIVMGVGILLYGGEAMGILPVGTVDKVDSLLIVLGLGALRAGIVHRA